MPRRYAYCACSGVESRVTSGSRSRRSAERPLVFVLLEGVLTPYELIAIRRARRAPRRDAAGATEEREDVRSAVFDAAIIARNATARVACGATRRPRTPRASSSRVRARRPARRRPPDGATAGSGLDGAPLGAAALADAVRPRRRAGDSAASPSQSHPASLRSAHRSIVEPSGRVATNWMRRPADRRPRRSDARTRTVARSARLLDR